MTTTKTDEIKTWQQRLEETCPAIGPMHIHASVEEVNDAMIAEIDDLRAALQEQAREGEAVAPLIKQITEAICAGQKQRSRESSKGTSQIPWTHTVGACAEVGNGANEHLQYRVGQTNAERSDHQCNSGCSGVSSGGAVCGQVAPQPAQPESIECDCGRIHKKTRYGWACSEPVALPLTPEELDLCRQWFDSVQDLNGGYLTPLDYVLAEKLYKQLNMRVPNSVSEITKSGIGGGR